MGTRLMLYVNVLHRVNYRYETADGKFMSVGA